MTDQLPMIALGFLIGLSIAIAGLLLMGWIVVLWDVGIYLVKMFKEWRKQ